MSQGVMGSLGPREQTVRSGPVHTDVTTRAELDSALTRRGFAFVAASDMRPMLDDVGSLSDWDAFAASWNDLALDTYMKDGGRYRRRRHAVYSVARDGTIARKAHQAHYQSLDHNNLNGGIDRWFEPVQTEIGASASMRSLLEFSRTTFGVQSPATTSWHVEVHQFRIEARPDEPGNPTPEGMHRDGVDHVLVLLVGRRNVAQGTTTIAGSDGRDLGSFTLADPLDAALVDDHRVFHGVTPIEPFDPALPAYRDVLVLTFRKQT